MSYTTTATVEGKLAKCKDRWSCFDNNLRKRLEEDVTKNIFEMIEERINHTKVFMPIMEELIKTLKQSQKELTEAKISLKRIEILSKYRDWIKRLRSVVVRKMNEEEGKKFENWDGLEETLRNEM